MALQEPGLSSRVKIGAKIGTMWVLESHMAGTSYFAFDHWHRGIVTPESLGQRKWWALSAADAVPIGMRNQLPK